MPLYEQITVGVYLFVINLRRHVMKELVDKERTTPTGTPLVRRQVKTQPYFFSFQSCFTLKGLKKSTPSLEGNGFEATYARTNVIQQGSSRGKNDLLKRSVRLTRRYEFVAIRKE